MSIERRDVEHIKQKQLRLFEDKHPHSPALPVLQSRVFFYRTANRLTQAQLGMLVGVSRNTIYQIESERTIPSALLALQIAEALKTSVDKLFGIRYHLQDKHQYKAFHPARMRLRHMKKP